MGLSYRLLRLLPLLVILLSLLANTGCASRDPYSSRVEQRSSIERPARTIEEETEWYDHIGQVGVVLLVVGLAVGGILVPLFLLN